MIRKISLSLFIIFILLFSLSAIHASEVNATDFDAADDGALEIEGDIQSDDIKGEILANASGNQTQITAPASMYYRGYYNVTLTDSDTNATLANKTVSFIINDVEYTNTTNDEGIASVRLNLAPGKYIATVTFEGGDGYADTSLTSQIQILPTVKASDVTKYYKGSAKYTATFFDSYGNALANTQVNITVNGKVYTRKTNAKGVVNLALDFKPNTFKMVATDPVTGYKKTTTVKILSTLSASDLKKVKGDGRKFTAKFLKSDGKALASQYVKIKINGKTKSYKTNSKGQVSLTCNDLKKGTYKATCYNKDGLSQTYTVQIYNIANTKLTVSTPKVCDILPKDSRIIKIKLKTSLGANANVGKIVKIKIDGKTYNRKTDSNGEINFKLPVDEGIFTIVYEYAGDKFFKPSKETSSLTVFKTNDTKLTVKSVREFGYGAGTMFKVAFTAGKVPIAKRTVTFTVDGKTYKDVTDSKGIAEIRIDLNIGNYTMGYRVSADSRVKGTSGSCAINVFKRSPSKITWESKYSFKDNSQSFKFLVVNSKGEPVSGGIVEMTIDGETYKVKTSSKGYVTIKTEVPIGKYKVSGKFIGNNYYLPSSVTKSINVALSKFGSGLNVKDGGYYSNAYLRSTAHCQVNSAKIKALVKSLTSGLKDDVDKVKALFNYVRDNIVYDYYYNTHHGAVGTLNAKSGNCVDQAHLLIAMYRTAGYKARYVHGTCVFSDGTFGHVWTQVKVGNTWIVGDPINYKNDLGKIKNWNTNTYKMKTRYISCPF